MRMQIRIILGKDTGDASKDDPLNEDEIGENEILVVSFGTSFNDSRTEDIGGVEKAIAEAYPDWSGKKSVYRTDYHQPCTGER